MLRTLHSDGSIAPLPFGAAGGPSIAAITLKDIKPVLNFGQNTTETMLQGKLPTKAAKPLPINEVGDASDLAAKPAKPEKWSAEQRKTVAEYDGALDAKNIASLDSQGLNTLLSSISTSGDWKNLPNSVIQQLAKRMAELNQTTVAGLLDTAGTTTHLNGDMLTSVPLMREYAKRTGQEIADLNFYTPIIAHGSGAQHGWYQNKNGHYFNMQGDDYGV